MFFNTLIYYDYDGLGDADLTDWGGYDGLIQ